jgi:uncharacterized protein YjbI with pentapeptide repeats
VDFSGSSPQSASFRGAYLAGSTLTAANLSEDSDTGKRTHLSSTWVQGTSFTDTMVTGAIFTVAMVDGTQSSDSRGQALVLQLDVGQHLAFPG